MPFVGPTFATRRPGKLSSRRVSITFWLCAACAAWGAYQLVRGLLSRKRGVHTFGAASSALLRGKSVSPWLLVVNGVLIVACSVVAMVVVSKSLEIPIPEGWVDLSPGVPHANFTTVKVDGPLAARMAESTRAAAISDEGRVSFFEARISHVPFDAKIDTLSKIASDHVQGLGNVAGAEPVVSEIELVPFAGAQAGRYTVTLTNRVRAVKTKVYVLPSRTSRAVLVYTADARDYESHLPDFERAVAEVTGVAPRIPPPQFLPGLAILVTGVATMALARRREPV